MQQQQQQTKKKTTNASVHDVVSVSARDPARAAAFASAHGARRHCSSYAALADDEEVEVVYVGVVSPVHLEVVKMMLQAGGWLDPDQYL